MFTIALYNGILLITRLGREEREHARRGGIELVVRVTAESAFPVVVTAVALALAVLPFVWRGTIPGMEIVRPFGLIVAGGLVTSTLYSLFVLPALYLRLVAPSVGAGAATKQQEVTS